MSIISKFLDVNTIAFSILNYPMSYIELVGTIFYLWSVWLIAKRKMLTWPIGIVSVILYFFLFYQIRLYSDAAEQVYYLGASIYGWWYWNKGKQEEKESVIKISSPIMLFTWAISTIVVSIGVSSFVSRLHIIFPIIFPEPASFPFLDALTTIMSFTAMFLMAKKYFESWIYWIIIDAVGIWLYFVKDVKFLSLLYVILLIIAVKGLFEWLKNMEKYYIKGHARNFS